MNIKEYVEKLPEIYQRIYNHPEFDKTSRLCEDRESYIVECVTSLQKKIGRKELKVLDLGCAQGYFSLTLQSLGCSVTGIDFCKENIDLCKALAEENNFGCNFRQDVISKEFVDNIKSDEYDVILFLSVVHHICHANGFDYARNLFSALADKSQIVITELAVKEEPLYWNDNLPAKYEEWFTTVKFYNELSMFPTHLSGIVRPLIIYSNKFVYCEKKYFAFTEYKTKAYELKPEDRNRRYYLSEDYLIKYCRAEIKVFCDEIINELNFVKNNSNINFLPKLIAYETKPNAICVYKINKGKNLIDYILNKEKLDFEKIFLDILDNLIELEINGYYHGDLRVWNVCIKNDTSFLIDFGNIQQHKIDSVANQFNKDFTYTVYDSFIAFMYDVLTYKSYSSIQQSYYYCLKALIQDSSIDVVYINFFKQYLLLKPENLSYEIIKHLFIDYVVNKKICTLSIEEKADVLQQEIVRGLSEKINKEDSAVQLENFNKNLFNLNNFVNRINVLVQDNKTEINNNSEKLKQINSVIDNQNELISSFKNEIADKEILLHEMQEQIIQQQDYIKQLETSYNQYKDEQQDYIKQLEISYNQYKDEQQDYIKQLEISYNQYKEQQQNYIKQLKSDYDLRIGQTVELINTGTKNMDTEVSSVKQSINVMDAHINQVHNLLLFTKNRTLYGFCAWCFRKIFKKKNK